MEMQRCLPSRWQLFWTTSSFRTSIVSSAGAATEVGISLNKAKPSSEIEELYLIVIDRLGVVGYAEP